MAVHPVYAQRFIQALHNALEKVEKHPKAKAALLGTVEESCFLVTDPEAIPFLLVPFAGSSQTEQHLKNWKSCFQNIETLRQFPSRDLSGESATPKGALRTPDALLSYAGPPPGLCEILMLMVAVQMRLLTKEKARSLLYHFPNQYVSGSVDDLKWE